MGEKERIRYTECRMEDETEKEREREREREGGRERQGGAGRVISRGNLR